MELLPRLQLLVSCGEYVSGPSWGSSIETSRVRKSQARIMLSATKHNAIVDALQVMCTTITVTPLALNVGGLPGPDLQ